MVQRGLHPRPRPRGAAPPRCSPLAPCRPVLPPGPQRDGGRRGGCAATGRTRPRSCGRPRWQGHPPECAADRAGSAHRQRRAPQPSGRARTQPRALGHDQYCHHALVRGAAGAEAGRPLRPGAARRPLLGRRDVSQVARGAARLERVDGRTLRPAPAGPDRRGGSPRQAGRAAAIQHVHLRSRRERTGGGRSAEAAQGHAPAAARATRREPRPACMVERRTLVGPQRTLLAPPRSARRSGTPSLPRCWTASPTPSLGPS
jgi:hypothetical protein